MASESLRTGRRAETLRLRYPTLKFEPDAIFVRDDAVWSSAGVSAGIDLALALVEEDCGRDVAMSVARQLVVYMKRPGGQAQFSELLRAQAKDCEPFAELHEWLADHLHDESLSVETLARKACMSARNFARVYKTKTGRTPAKAIELFRLETARRLLEDTDERIETIARRTGFGDEDRMRNTFQRHLNVSPRDYRERFGQPDRERGVAALHRSSLVDSTTDDVVRSTPSRLPMASMRSSISRTRRRDGERDHVERAAHGLQQPHRRHDA